MKLNNEQLLEAVNKFGSPLYVYDSRIIELQYNEMKQAFNNKNIKIIYACKALSNISVLKFIHSLGCGLDAVSIQEIQLGLLSGYTPNEIYFTPNGVSIEEIEEAISLGVNIHVDNLELLEYIGHKHNGYPIGIRLNPHIMAGGHHHISVGHIDSKFGISIHQLPLIKRLVSTLDINVKGLHMHTGSDILDADVFIAASDIMFEAAAQFETLQYLDLGSGFKVPYKYDDYATDLNAFGKKIDERLTMYNNEYKKNLQLIFEPGKYIVSEAGYFLVKTNVVKQTTSTVFAAIDSGFNHLIRPMFYDAYHRIENISNADANPKIYSVVGYLCETDTFAWNRKIAEVRAGDILCFSNAGAYGFSMSSNYNSRFKPAEVMYLNNEFHLIKSRETMDDILRNQIMI